MNNSHGITRRNLLKTAAGASVAALAGGNQSTTAAAEDGVQTQPDLIEEENRKPGALDWQLTRVRIDKRGGYRASAIEGYCSHQSVEAGDALRIMVSTTPAAKFKIEIFRTGYYDGRGARLMTTLGPFAGKPQPTPPVGPRRLRECRWEPSVELKIPADWPSGVYLGRLTTLSAGDEEPYWQSYVVFIVRDQRPADILFQCSDNTWQAYNWLALQVIPSTPHPKGEPGPLGRCELRSALRARTAQYLRALSMTRCRSAPASIL